jgi:carboxymethylenebutenolidase
MHQITKNAVPLLTFVCYGATAALAQVQEAVEHYPSGEAHITVECFSPGADGKFPAVLLLHGSGGLDPGTADVFREIGRGLASLGYVALVPHYFEKTGHVVGARSHDDELKSYREAVNDGIEFAVTMKNVDPERIGLVGYSMGAYLAFFRSARDPRVKAVVSCSGPLPVESKAKFPPVLILQGSKDKGSPAERLKAFAEKLKASETPYATHIYRGMGHNFDIPAWDDASRRIAVFFDRHLKINEPKRSKAKLKQSPKSESPGPS